jgi:CBS domain-containing protein
MKVREIMTSEGLATATLDTTLAEIAERMRDENVGAIPVVDEDEKLCGIITDRDIVVRAIAEGEDPQECTAEEILSEQLHTIDPDADLEDAADLMARHQIRRLPVVEDEVVVGMISLGDIAVKSEEDEASDVLEDVSEGVRQSDGGQRGRQQTSGRGQQQQTRNRGISERGGSVDSQFNAAGRQSSGERVAEEETEYQRTRGGHSGGTRAENANAARARNQSQSRQSIANDVVDVEGEEEPDLQNAGGGQARQRANQQSQSARGRQGASVRGRQGGEVRGESANRSQGISNRSQKEESQRQQKVTPMRAEARSAGRGGKNKRKAS